MAILIWGSGDPHSKAVLEECARRKILAYHVNARWGTPRTRVSFETGRLEVNGTVLDPSALIVRAMTPYRIDAGEFERSVNADGFGSFMQYDCEHRNRFDMFLGWTMHLENRKIPMLNSPRGMYLSRRKPLQLMTMQRLGIDHPKTLISNNADKVRSFIKANPHSIAKPVGGGALTLDTSKFTEEDFKFMTNSPSIFQERVDGEDLRIIVVGDEVVSAVSIDLPEGTLDFRGDETYSSGQASYTEVELPKDVEEDCIRFTREMGLTVGGIDIKRTEDGRHAMLEVNSCPMYLDVERKTGHPVTARMVDWALKKAIDSNA